MENKIKAGEKLKKAALNDEEDEDKLEKPIHKKTNKKNKKIIESSEDEEVEWETASEREDEEKEVKMIITKKDIENDIFEWKYFSNPLEENSFLIERKSSIDKVTEDVKEIFVKNRFDEDYLTKLGK